MTRTVLNLIALLVAIGLAVGAGLGQRPQENITASAVVITVIDATGTAVPVGSAQRVVSLSIFSDRVLMRLVSGQRVVARCAWSDGDWLLPWVDKPSLRGAEEIEALLALRPDLVIVAGTGGPAVQQLRNQEIRVFCLGNLDGWATAQRLIAELGTLTGTSAAAQRLLGEYASQEAVLALAWPAVPERALYVGVTAAQIFGGTVGSGYHDVLTLAGCSDVAATRFTGWPTLSMEDLYALAPDVIITAQGSADMLRRLPGADRLFQQKTRIVEIPGENLNDPGLGLLQAAITVRAKLNARVGADSGGARPPDDPVIP